MTCGNYCKIIIALLFSVSIKANILQQGSDIIISPTNFNDSFIDGHAYYNYSMLNPLSESSINITDALSKFSFIIIQVHSQESNVTLLSNGTKTTDVSGYNIGLYIDSLNIPRTAISVRNNNNETVEVMVVAVGYISKALVPGGCNMESKVDIAPFQELKLTDTTVTVNTPPASTDENSCSENTIKYQSYRLLIPHGDFTNTTYFSAIRNMLTVDDIIKNGEKISPAIVSSSLIRIYSAHPGTGSVYAMIASIGNHSVAYIPSFSYACGPVSNAETCYALKTSFSKILCACIFFIGFSMTFIGYRALRFQVMLLGSVSSGIICYVVLNLCGIHDSNWQIGLTMAIGLLVGIICSSCWTPNKQFIAIFQAAFTLGALIASITYTKIPDDNVLFKNNLSFWAIYVGICFISALIFGPCSITSAMICYSILGAYGIILPFDYWLGANLKYIVINTIRRIYVPGFNVATVNTPFETTDIWLTIFWVLVALLGLCIQRCRHGSGKYTYIQSADDFPTLSAERHGRRVLVLLPGDTVSQNCW